ncbi:MAG: metallophosphoesterase family protein [Phycisphaerae bacterium]|nr:metallophosphoesterase family protein [Phycisphaerae bacterium]
MMFAVISDIHSNLEALQVVLADIEARGVERIFCLGDVVGYGPSPCECIDLIIDRCEVCLCGNHDHAVFYEPYNFNVGAERAAYWTRQVFENEPNKAARDRRWEFLGGLPIRYESDGMLFVHGSPRRPVNEYLFADDVYTNPNKLMANFERMEHVASFVGHTHVPGVFMDDPYFESPDELTEPGRYEIADDDRVIINVGSVGQPRDRDPRASYVVVNEGEVEFIRLEYDVESVVQKILAVGELDDFLAHRLLDGR